MSRKTVMDYDGHEPESDAWRAVATLEQKHFTKREIADTLEDVAARLRAENDL